MKIYVLLILYGLMGMITPLYFKVFSQRSTSNVATTNTATNLARTRSRTYEKTEETTKTSTTTSTISTATKNTSQTTLQMLAASTTTISITNNTDTSTSQSTIATTTNTIIATTTSSATISITATDGFGILCNFASIKCSSGLLCDPNSNLCLGDIGYQCENDGDCFGNYLCSNGACNLPEKGEVCVKLSPLHLSCANGTICPCTVGCVCL